MAHAPKIIVFDFDGVVCDSTDECMVTSWNAWERWNDREAFRRSVNEFSVEEKQAFRPLRPYVKGAGEYYILRRALSDQEVLPIRNQQDYEQTRERWAGYLAEFKDVFFAERNRLRSEDIVRWIGLHPVYPEIIQVMKKLQEESRLYIATLKDAESVYLIMKNQGLILSNDRLFDQGKIKTKLEALDLIRHKENCEKEEMLFIDDNVTHLFGPLNSRYNCWLAGWGYILSDHQMIAKERKINIVCLSDISRLIQKNSHQ